MWLGLGLAIIPPLATAVWGFIVKSDAANVTRVGAMQGVTVAVGPTASAGAQSAAADPAVPGVTAKA